MKKQLAILMILALAVGVSAPTAHAALTLTLDDGVGHQLTIPDGGLNDGSALTGAVLYSGSLGNWLINVSTGISQPTLGTETGPSLDLNSINLLASGSGTLTLQLTDTGFTVSNDVAADAHFVSAIGGTVANGGTIMLTQLLDRQNNPFASGVTVDIEKLESGLLGPGAFSDTRSKPVSGLLGMEFSLTEVVTLHHENGGTSSFDASVSVVPVPAAILLGVLGLGAAGLKLRKHA